MREVLMKLRALWRRRQLESDLEDELAFHLAMREEKNRQAGVAESARRSFGDAALVKEDLRDQWTFRAVETFWRDLRYAARMLRNSPHLHWWRFYRWRSGSARESLWMVAAGLVIGIPAALALTRLVSASLYGIQPNDPTSFVGAGVLMVVVAAGSAWIPARRAARVDPMRALRCE